MTLKELDKKVQELDEEAEDLTSEDSVDVLVADDEDCLCELHASHLESRYHVRKASSVRECIALLEQGYRPKHFVLDYDFKPGTGLDIIRYCEQHGIKGNFVICSGSPGLEQAVASHQVKLFSKPVNYNRFVKYLEEKDN